MQTRNPAKMRPVNLGGLIVEKSQRDSLGHRLCPVADSESSAGVREILVDGARRNSESVPDANGCHALSRKTETFNLT